MASEVDIANNALSILGSSTTIVSLDPPDGQAAAGYAVRHFAQARRLTIESGSWKFAKRRVVLTQVENPSSIWSFAYALPADCLKALRVIRLAASFNPLVLYPYGWPATFEEDLYDESAGADYEVENGVLLTHEPKATLIYLVDVTDTTKYTPAFVEAFSMMLASYLAGPVLRGNEGIQARGDLRKQAMMLVKAASALDGRSSSARQTEIPASVRARW